MVAVPERVDNLEAASEIVRSGRVGLILTYVVDPAAGAEVARWVEELQHTGISVPLVVLMERDDPQLLLQLVRRGVTECLSRPLNLSRLALLVDMYTLRRRLGCEETPPRQASPTREATTEVGDCLFGRVTMGTLLEQLRRVALLSSTVLLTGETGTGKTHCARLLHDLSQRKHRPFVVVPCGSLTSTLLSSEMFGHVRGSFTGADSDHRGKFAEADDGTVLLDEIDCIPLEAQSRLLRVVEDRVYEPVGSTKPQRVRARIVVTANRPLEEEVDAGRFRSDLFYRLNVVNLRMLPLRSRRPLIRPLVHRFVQQFSSQTERRQLKVTPTALDALEAYEWPGNVRELRNVIEGVISLCPADTIGLCDLPEHIERASRLSGNKESKEEAAQSNQKLDGDENTGRSRLESARRRVEREQLLSALHRHNNNRTNAAADLGISRVTLYKKLHRYGLT